jgi:SAM-dependent methyltransferase
LDQGVANRWISATDRAVAQPSIDGEWVCDFSIHWRQQASKDNGRFFGCGAGALGRSVAGLHTFRIYSVTGNVEALQCGPCLRYVGHGGNIAAIAKGWQLPYEMHELPEETFMPMTRNEIEGLRSKINANDIADPQNVEVLGHLSREDREQFAHVTGVPVLYFGAEVPEVQQAEESAALRAAPQGFDLAVLQGLNIGCGTRTISPYLLPVDIMRQQEHGAGSGEHGALNNAAFLALSDDLPFKPGSIDFVVALHMLEHVEDPVKVILHWLDIVKPGGGVGIVVPDWRYTWDSRSDSAPYGHKWNPTPDLIRDLYRRHWRSKAELESIDTYDHKISFDFVLRKPGKFEPFAAPPIDQMKSGAERHRSGVFLHGE